MSKTNSLTQEQYNTLDKAYKFFNNKLFNNELPDCMLVLHRKGKRNLGYFHAARFRSRAELELAKQSKKKSFDFTNIDELSLNPDNFFGRSDIDILSTLAHEMAHVWQFHCTEKFPRNGYHDKAWGRKMEEIGLMPSNTGKEGGKRTGQQMDHYVIAGGLFEQFVKQFVKSNSIKLTSFPLLKASASDNKNKSKYICPSCDAKVWGKPGMNIQCGDCEESYEEQ